MTFRTRTRKNKLVAMILSRIFHHTWCWTKSSIYSTIYRFTILLSFRAHLQLKTLGMHFMTTAGRVFMCVCEYANTKWCIIANHHPIAIHLLVIRISRRLLYRSLVRFPSVDEGLWSICRCLQVNIHVSVVYLFLQIQFPQNILLLDALIICLFG